MVTMALDCLASVSASSTKPAWYSLYASSATVCLPLSVLRSSAAVFNTLLALSFSSDRSTSSCCQCASESLLVLRSVSIFSSVANLLEACFHLRDDAVDDGEHLRHGARSRRLCQRRPQGHHLARDRLVVRRNNRVRQPRQRRQLLQECLVDGLGRRAAAIRHGPPAP